MIFIVEVIARLNSMILLLSLDTVNYIVMLFNNLVLLKIE